MPATVKAAVQKLAIAPMMDWMDVSKNVEKSIAKGFEIREVVPTLYW
ncbi:MAG: hypothetical protein RIB97_15710 [Nitratireductor sp.]